MQDYRYGMDYGVGINSLSGQSRGDGVIYGGEEEISEAGGQTVYFQMKKIETMEELEQSLGISAEVEASYLLSKVSASFDFAQSISMNSFSIYLMVKVTVKNAFRQIRDVRLKPQAYDLLKQGKLKRFREQYGDGFVRGFSTGGAYYGLLEFKTQSQQQRQEVSAALEGSVGGFGAGVDFKASFNQSASSASEKCETDIRTFVQGGIGYELPTTPEMMVHQAVNFPEEVHKKAVPYEALIKDYKILDMPDLPNEIDLENARDVLRQLSYMRREAWKDLNDVNYILVNQEHFINPNMDDLNSDADALGQYIRNVTRAASKAINRPLDASMPEGLKYPEIVLPDLKDGSNPPMEKPQSGYRRPYKLKRADKPMYRKLLKQRTFLKK